MFITHEKKCSIIREVRNLEIEAATKGYPLNKSPSVEGYPIKFFHHQWATTQESTCKAMMEFFRHGKILKSYSSITITLVPKIPNPTVVNDCGPIAYYTIFCKVITKTLTNRI